MNEKILLSGYTVRAGKGIYSSTLDTDTFSISKPEPVIEIEKPTYLDISNNLHLYTIEQQDNYGGVAAYDLNDGKYQFINSSLKEGAAPSHVQYDPTRNMVYSCQFHGGKIYVDKVLDSGELKHLYTINLSGKGPKPEQDSSHPHYSGLTPDNKLIVCDYGTDKISIFDLSDDMEPKLLSEFKAPSGYAPRHLVFHPKHNIAYVICELSSKVLLMDYNPDTHQLKLESEISTIPTDFDSRKNTAAAIRISNDGKYLYASNRGHDSIAIYKLSKYGDTLSCIDNVPVEGNGPRDFNLDPTEKFVVCANEKSDNITLFERNTHTGLLTTIKKDIEIPECTCVKFI